MATHRFSVPGKKSKEMLANIPASKKLNGIEANATYFNNFRSLGTNTDTNNKNTKGITLHGKVVPLGLVINTTNFCIYFHKNISADTTHIQKPVAKQRILSCYYVSREN